MFGLFAAGFTRADAARLRRVEQKLDLILAHLGIPYTDPDANGELPADVRELADRGEKIGAIKLLRERTGAGLADAKRAVEAYLGGRAG